MVAGQELKGIRFGTPSKCWRASKGCVRISRGGAGAQRAAGRGWLVRGGQSGSHKHRAHLQPRLSARLSSVDHPNAPCRLREGYNLSKGTIGFTADSRTEYCHERYVCRKGREASREYCRRRSERETAAEEAAAGGGHRIGIDVECSRRIVGSRAASGCCGAVRERAQKHTCAGLFGSGRSQKSRREAG